MSLQTALTHISIHRFYEICGYTYMTLSHGNHQDLSYEELPEKMQKGIIELIVAVYRVQKMVYSYDIEFVTHNMKDCGIIMKPFFDGCEINKTFYRTLTLTYDREARLMRVRLELIRMLNRLFRYVLD